jgi:Na+/glutamate symporter
MDNATIEVIKWAIAIAGFGLFLVVVGSEAIARGIKKAKDREQEEKRNGGRP